MTTQDDETLDFWTISNLALAHLTELLISTSRYDQD